MSSQHASVPESHAESVQFYDDRYASGYLETWPEWKRTRVRELVRELPLPERGTVLDFGCGNGVFTRVLVEALPGWTVMGTDISPRALERARREVQGASFFTLGEMNKARTFDLVFTHHVLEHVIDLQGSLDQIDAVLGPASAVLHILPCGNPGSLEHRICRLRRDGIDTQREGRFFFEEAGHLRRLDSARLGELYAERGLKLEHEAYACQSAGAINWITRSGAAFIRSLLDPEAAVDEDAARELAKLRRRMLRIAFLRQLPRRVAAGLRRGRVGLLARLRLIALLPLYPLGRLVDRHCDSSDVREWREHREQRAGSEMYLHFSRRDKATTC